MSNKADNDTMNSLHAAVADILTKRLQGDAAQGSDISNAIKFLKDNGIEADGATNPGLQGLARQFPDFKDQDDDTVLPN